jgi:hypothetical protein
MAHTFDRPKAGELVIRFAGCDSSYVQKSLLDFA